MILLNKLICVKLQFFQKFFFPLVIQLYFKNENKQTKKKRSQVDEVRAEKVQKDSLQETQLRLFVYLCGSWR